MSDLSLDPNLDPRRLADSFVGTKRLQIGDFIDRAAAEALGAELAARPDWVLTANRGEQVVDFTADRLAGMDADAHAKLARAVTLGGRYTFQFFYETIRLPKGPKAASASTAQGASTALDRFAAFMSSPSVIAFMRALTGDPRIDFADAHASRYRPGHFLTAHDDEAPAMNRRAAYVLNLSPEWRTDWGGLLLFHDAAGHVTQGFRPAFNTLNLFAVPQAHSVSFVTPLAGAPRYAVTGWLRSGAPD